MRTVEKQVFTFDELSESVKSRVLDKFRDINVNYDEWCDYIFDDFQEVAKRLGFDINRKDIRFTGFYSQGDGASFTGSLILSESWTPKDLINYKSNDEALKKIAESLSTLTSSIFDFYHAMKGDQIDVEIKSHSVRDVHECNVYCEVDQFAFGETFGDECPKSVSQSAMEYDDSLTDEVLRPLCRWLYSQLESAYDGFTSDEFVKESIEANKFEFYADGEIHHD